WGGGPGDRNRSVPVGAPDGDEGSAVDGSREQFHRSNPFLFGGCGDEKRPAREPARGGCASVAPDLFLAFLSAFLAFFFFGLSGPSSGSGLRPRPSSRSPALTSRATIRASRVLARGSAFLPCSSLATRDRLRSALTATSCCDRPRTS